MHTGFRLTNLLGLYKFSPFIILTIAALNLVGCGNTTPQIRTISGVTVEPITTPTPTPYPFRTSTPGTATVRGKLIVIDPTSLVPASKDSIFLVPLPADTVSGIPQFKVGEVPQADVNEHDGEFTFTDIKPGKYVVVVQTISGSQIPATTYKDRKIVVVTVENSNLDKTMDLGLLSFP